MKALQLTRVGQLDLIDAAIPNVPDGYMLVRTAAAVICTSDLNDIRANPFHIALPVILGHEGAGTVAGLGKGASGFAVGDRVAAHPVHPCRKCPHCQAGMEHLCSRMGHFGLNLPGTFAEHFVVRCDRARNVGDMPLALAALAEPVCVCLEALAQANTSAGGRLLILGDGPFGAMTAILAEELELSQVVLAGHHDFRLNFASAATKVNLKRDDGPPRLRELSGPLGLDAAVLAVGSAQAAALALELLRPKGRLVVFSALPGATPVDFFRLHVRELEIVGACNDHDRLDNAIARLRSRRASLERLITHALPLEQYREAIELANTGRDSAMKVAFTLDPKELQS